MGTADVRNEQEPVAGIKLGGGGFKKAVDYGFKR